MKKKISLEETLNETIDNELNVGTVTFNASIEYGKNKSKFTFFEFFPCIVPIKFRRDIFLKQYISMWCYLTIWKFRRPLITAHRSDGHQKDAIEPYILRPKSSNSCFFWRKGEKMDNVIFQNWMKAAKYNPYYWNCNSFYNYRFRRIPSNKKREIFVEQEHSPSRFSSYNIWSWKYQN